MPIRTVAQAAAEIRLSSTQANSDFERIRRDLIAKATRLEADMAVTIPVTVDQNSLRNVASGLQRLQQAIPPIVVPVDINDDALAVDFGEGLTIPPIVVPVTVDTDQALGDLIALTELDIVIPVSVRVDTDQALDDLAALSDLDVTIEVGLAIDTEAVDGEIAGLANINDNTVTLGVTVDSEQAARQLADLADVDPIEIPVHIQTEGTLGQITGLGGGGELLGLTIPVRANTAEVTRAITQVTTLAEGPFTVKFQADVGDVRGKVTALGGLVPDGVDIPLTADNSEAIASVRAVGDSAQPITIAVLADTDPLTEKVAATKLPPLHVQVTAAEVGPGIAASPGLARIRAELASLEQNPAHVTVVADGDNAVGTITAIATDDYPPAVVPVVSDDSGFHLPGGPGGPPPDPVVVPLSVDDEAARAQVQHFGTSVGEQVAPDFERGGQRAGEAFGRSLLSTANRVLSVGALALGGFFATSLVEGFQRFTTIQDSTASLTVALQSATKAAQTLDDVLNVVKGTPFRLDDFARAATNMISFGIAAEKVPLFLTAIGEAAATRGSQANQFAQSLATIFGQVQAIGKINGEDIWQFGNVGVDALRILGNTVGVTTAEIRKMISEGAIPAGFALDALAQGILHGTEGINGATVAFSGVMEKLGDTLSGSIENFGAARARFGVAIIDPISETLVAGFQSFTHVIDDFTARTKVAFADIDRTPVFEAINEFFENAPDLIDPTVDALERLGPALAPLAIAFSALGLGALGAALGPLGALIPGVTGIGGALTVAAGAAAILTPEIRDELIPTLQELGGVGVEVGGSIVRGLSDALEGVAPTIARGLGVIRDSVPDLRGLFATALGSVGELGPDVQPILEHLVDFIQQALPIAIRATSQAIVFVTAAVDAALPVVDQLVQAGTDLLPLVSTILDVAQVAGTVLIPVLDTLGELLGDLPVGVLETLLGVFLGFKAVGFVQGIFDGIALSSKKASTSVGDFTRNVAVGIPVASKAAVAAGSAVSGAFAGMALASEDSSTRIVGAIGGIGTVLTGLALGGLPGGVFAGIGVALGFIAQGFIDAKREAEALEEAVGQLADRIRSEFDGDLVTPEGLINSKAIEDALGNIGGDGLNVLKQKLGIGLTEIQAAAGLQAAQVADAVEKGLNPKDVTVFDDFVNEQVARLARLEEAAKGFTFSDEVNKQIAAIDLSNLEGDDQKLNIFAHQLADQFGLAFEDVRAQITATREAQAELGPDFRKQMDIIGRATTDAVEKNDFFNRSIKATGDAAGEAGDAQVSAAEKADDALAKWKKALLDDGITMDELREQAKTLGDEAVTSADRASEAFKRFGTVLDSIKGKLDLRVQAQNLDQDFRDITSALNDVVNTDDIKRAEGLNQNIDDSNDRLLELKAQLARAVQDGNEKLAAFDSDIAIADATGSVNRAAELRARRARTARELGDDQGDIQKRIDEELDKLRDLRDQVAELTTSPITGLQQLTAQAAEANLSFFDFLLAAPTPEAQKFFQDGIVSAVNDAVDRAADVGLTDPLAGARLAEQFLAPFRQSLVDGGIPAEVVDQIIAEVWPPDRITLGAEQAAQAALEAFRAQVETDTTADAGTIDLSVEITDLQQQRDDLNAFITDHPDIEIPINVDELDQSILDLRARDIQEKIDARLAQVKTANDVQFLEGFGGPAAVARAFPTEQKLAEDAARKQLEDIQSFMDEPGNSLELRADIVDAEKTRDEFETLISTQNVQLPADLNINNINLLLTEAQKLALVQQFKELLGGAEAEALPVLPTSSGGVLRGQAAQRQQQILDSLNLVFAEGGITGYRDTPHMPQIAFGNRMWAEPETGGEAYLPLGMGKRVSALGVFMKVAEIFDLDVRQRREHEQQDREQLPVLMVPSSLPPAVERTFTDHDDVRIVTPEINVTSEFRDRLVHILEGGERTEIFTPGPEHTNLFAAPDVTLPEVTQMFKALDARGAESRGLDQRTIRQAMIEALQATRAPLTQDEYMARVSVDKLYLGGERGARRQAFEFLDEMRRLIQ